MADIFPESREEEILVSMIDGEEYNKAPESRIEALLLELKEVIEEGGGGGGTTNYNLLQNKPSINSVTLTGNKSLEDLSIPTAADLAGKQDALPVTASGNDVAFNGDIIDGQGNTLSVLAEALTKTASGNPVVITDCAGGKARSLKTTINAIQDLHDLPFPYVGGAYKNKLPMTVASIKAANTGGTWSGNVYAISNGTFEILTDIANNVTGIKVNGTFNNTVTFLIDSTYKTLSDMFGSGDFKLSQGIINIWTSGSSGLALQKQEPGSNICIPVNETEISFSTTDTNHYRPILRFYSGESADNAVFLPMVRVSTESDIFAPYSNICSISGRIAVAVDDTGRNIWDEQWEVGMISSVNGQNEEGSSTIRSQNYIPVTPSTNYYIWRSQGAVILFYASDKSYITYQNLNNGGAFTTPQNAKYIRFRTYIAYGTTYHNDICINISDASFNGQYVPYQHSYVIIQLGQTVYGADINLDTGVASVLSRAYDMGELNYEYLSDNNAFRSTSALPDATTENVFINSISSIYKEHQTGMANMTDGEFRVQGGIIYLKDFRFTSASDLKTALSGQTVVYDRATPSTIQLTPTQLELLKGYNKVTIESGSIEVGYIAKAISGNDEEIAPLVGDKATKAYAVNDFIERADGLYRVTASIASGASFTANNTVKMSIGEALTYLYNK